MALPDLHKFTDDLRNRPPKGSNAPPRSIRAKDLDKNFKLLTVIESDSADPVPYEVEYSKEGTRLKNIKQLPDGERLGDLAYWNPNSGAAGRWIVLRAVRHSDLHVLGIKNGKLQWVRTESCA